MAILSNLEYHNSILIKENLSQGERLIILNKEANRQKKLFNDNTVKVIKRLENEKAWGKIKETRLKEGMSQEAFAEELGYTSRSSINKIGKGVNEISYDKLML